MPWKYTFNRNFIILLPYLFPKIYHPSPLRAWYATEVFTRLSTSSSVNHSPSVGNRKIVVAFFSLNLYQQLHLKGSKTHLYTQEENIFLNIHFSKHTKPTKKVSIIYLLLVAFSLNRMIQ